jgi:hypothetical protein
MIEKLANLWEEPADAICITTNGFVKKNGELVMGRGVAKQAAQRYLDLPFIFGKLVREDGNHVHHRREHGPNGDRLFFTFPVKHNWWEEADLGLIERSAHELVHVTHYMPEVKKVLLPLPGCGNGQLSWREVKPVLEPILDDRFYLISNRLTEDFQPDDSEHS